MFEILQEFESAVSGDVRLSPVVLIGPGLICVIFGLFLWLGGLGFRKLLVPVAAAVTGSICAFFITENNLMLVLLSAAVAVVIAIIFERFFIAIMAGILTVVFTFVFLAGSYVESGQEPAPISSNRTSAQDSATDIRQSAENMKIYVVHAIQKIKRAYLQISLYKGLIIIALALVFMIAGFLFRRLASALCFSTLGTVLIFAGLILLLLYKGAVPVRIIYSRQSYYAIVFLTMIAFGTFEQLLLCRRPKTSSIGKKQEAKDEQQPVQTRKDWRTS
ncbi:MAG: hypothetical protein PVJ60_00240 [Phycisphaerales bacterium]|jgi:hypothetical protein